MAHKILIVDDDQINIAIVKFGLSERRYQVSVAEDGPEGLEKVEADKPDLIVLDIQMPKMNGLEFMGEHKQLQGFQITPVIMLTANETMQDVFKVEGVKGYFVKPIKLASLIQRIIECLGPNPI